MSPVNSQPASPGATSPGALGLRRRRIGAPKPARPAPCRTRGWCARAAGGSWLARGPGEGLTDWGDAPREAQSPALQLGSLTIRLRGWESPGCPPRQVGRGNAGPEDSADRAQAQRPAWGSLGGRIPQLCDATGETARCGTAASSTARPDPRSSATRRARPRVGRVPGLRVPPATAAPSLPASGAPSRTQSGPHPGSSPGFGAQPAPTPRPASCARPGALAH